jgi:hypothetical protein
LLANRSYGWDRHVYDIPYPKLVPAQKIAMAAKVIFTTAATFTRLSLLLFYYRLIADGGSTWFRWAIHVNVAYSIAILIAFFCEQPQDTVVVSKTFANRTPTLSPSCFPM